jgi:hypothetical protein
VSIQPVELAPDADPRGEIPPALATVALTPPLRAHARRTERQRRVFVLGYHPVGNPHGLSLRLHPAAPGVDERDAPGPRCGQCRFWVLLSGHRTHKCTRAPHAYAAQGSLRRGRGTAVAGWWPGCVDFESDPMANEED